MTILSSKSLDFGCPQKRGLQNAQSYTWLISDLRGYTLTHEPTIDALDQGRSDYITVNLSAGTSYGIVGVCDRDCRDLDIALYDSRGNRIASDLEDDDIPVITINPSRSGTYQVKVDMASCNTQACYYGIGVFGK